MKLYIITISDVYDYEGFHHAPIVCKTKEDAMRKLRDLRDNAKSELIDNGNYDWVEDEFTNESECFSTYLDGQWGTSHYDATIDEVEVED